jgi:uncharacterized iron-regulated membrane protein
MIVPGRRVLVWLHRWAGLAIALFVAVAGLTGSLLAFAPELNRALTPELFPPAGMGTPLDVPALVARTETLVPGSLVTGINFLEPGTAIVFIESRRHLGFDRLFFNRYTGAELARSAFRSGLPKGVDDIVPFLYRLHYDFALNRTGRWVMGIAAVVWTVDCFVGLVLTLPRARGFWAGWGRAWLFRWRGSAFPVTFALHRAAGLWVWVALLVFAWSSVALNLHAEVYTPATRLFLDYPERLSEMPKRAARAAQPRIGWRQAVEIGDRLLAEQGQSSGFAIVRPISLSYQKALGIYLYQAISSRDVEERHGRTYVGFDGNTGALRYSQVPTGQHNGTTVTMWLIGLHDADAFGLPYRLFVAVLGVVIAVLSGTGVFVWWRKHAARMASRRRATGRG